MGSEQYVNSNTSHFKKNYFDWVKLLEENWKDVQQEMRSVLDNPEKLSHQNSWTLAHPHYVESNDPNGWRTYEFYFFGIQQINHCLNCPKTFQLLQQIPDLVTAQFSVLKPNTKVDAHYGYTTMVLRNHLALEIPSQELCKIKIEDEETSWEEGKVITFDDSKLHEAWNLSNKRRIVLMIDVAKPDGEYSGDQINRYKIENIDDPFLLNIAPKETWLKWYEKGSFPTEGLSGYSPERNK